MINWNMVTAVATCLYVVIVGITLGYIHYQVRDLRANRKLQAALTIFKELQTREVRRARKYIYTRVPWDVERVSENELPTHLEQTEEAIAAFDLAGYLLREGHIARDATLSNYWRGVWKCWKKSEHLLRWARRTRNEPIFTHFDYLFEECEKYRREHNDEEPVL